MASGVSMRASSLDEPDAADESTDPLRDESAACSRRRKTVRRDHSGCIQMTSEEPRDQGERVGAGTDRPCRPRPPWTRDRLPGTQQASSRGIT